jgi:hypothetical protein
MGRGNLLMDCHIIRSKGRASLTPRNDRSPSMGIAHSPPKGGSGYRRTSKSKRPSWWMAFFHGWGQRSRTSISKFRVCCPAIRRAPSAQALYYHILTGFDKPNSRLKKSVAQVWYFVRFKLNRSHIHYTQGKEMVLLGVYLN